MTENGAVAEAPMACDGRRAAPQATGVEAAMGGAGDGAGAPGAPSEADDACPVPARRPPSSGGEAGQATVEAAVLLPTLLLILALLLEPICVLYTRSVMESTAAEICRVLATRGDAITESEIKAYARRRLRAVPEAPPFHAGGEDDWDIELEGAEGDASVSVKISGHAPLFPIYGSLARLFGVADGEGLLISVEVAETVRPSWLEGSYADWIQMWEH